ncbi:universal stress protein [Domibacillus enclensis]|uniref:Histidine kinase n=1 Tax=Domibacillus enclensis TaxID=1017273 RepID=A0A1N6SUA9_9BACI|nr:universal stress protein [Domibacillus enclensis]OXS79415.1 histidine kinase [Domibacillus enclensis]SIQ44476.1 Universal stress protein family protein [Domibacillus enclensis]
MKKLRARMDESILVCAYYGPNGERLIKRGAKLANMLDCPLYILNVESAAQRDLSADKAGYIDLWKALAEECGAEEFILRDHEKRPPAKVIAEVARERDITQIILGQSPQSRWEEIKKGSFVNTLMREISFVDFHIVSIDRSVEDDDNLFDNGTRAYLVKADDGHRIEFAYSDDVLFEGIFYKETGTDFNNGVFKFMKENRTCQLHVTDEKITEPTTIHSAIKEEKFDDEEPSE